MANTPKKLKFTPLDLDTGLDGQGASLTASSVVPATTLPETEEGAVAPLKTQNNPDVFYALQVISPVVAIFDNVTDLEAYLTRKKSNGYDVNYQHWVLEYPRSADEQEAVKRTPVIQFFHRTF